MNAQTPEVLSVSTPHQKWVIFASYVLVALTLFLVMLQGLLPGLLCLCIGFLSTRAIGHGFSNLCGKRSVGMQLRVPLRRGQMMAAALIILSPLMLLSLALSHSRTFVIQAPEQYREVLGHTARTILELREKLPVEMAQHLPLGAADVQVVVANFLLAQAGTLALTGKAWLYTLFFAYIGLIIGALAGCSLPPTARLPLAKELHKRIQVFGDAFRQIVAAQFWIAGFNMILTAIFLLVVLPWFGMGVPYAPILVTLTFLAGLVPIVGNLLCNAVITIAALSVSPATAAACLVFLIVIHKAEYVINAKVVGRRTKMAIWELLTVMFVAESVFGPAGLVAAPLFYAYLKKELSANQLA